MTNRIELAGAALNEVMGMFEVGEKDLYTMYHEWQDYLWELDREFVNCYIDCEQEDFERFTGIAVSEEEFLELGEMYNRYCEEEGQ